MANILHDAVPLRRKTAVSNRNSQDHLPTKESKKPREVKSQMQNITALIDDKSLKNSFE